jgi:outer membrane protein TolC
MDAWKFSRWLMALALGGGLLLKSLTSPTTVTAQSPLPASPSSSSRKDGPILQTVQVPAKADGLVAQQGNLPQPKQVGINDPDNPNNQPTSKPATAEPVDEILPISLPATLRLTNSRAWDIIIAQQQLRVAAADLEAADVLWLPTLIAGVDYTHYDGPIQNTDGSIINSSHSSLFTGAAPLAIFALTDAIFLPLSQRQVVRAQEANIQTATNDTLTLVAQTYFDTLEARADLAGIEDVNRRATEMVRKTEALAPGLIPVLETFRVRAAKYNFEQIIETSRQRWRDSSAEVARLARLKPTVLVDPLEPPQLRVTLVQPKATPEELIPVALATRPELTFQEAQSEAARFRMREEQFRPFLPILIARGSGNTPPDSLAFGVYGGGQGSTLNNFNLRDAWDLEAMWEVRNLGFGNQALIRGRRAQYDLARSEEYRFRDLVAREVTQAWADVRSADRRVAQAEAELKEALQSATLNLATLGEIKRAGGNIDILVVRPLEVVAALQALDQGYVDYFGAVADYNRAQFRLYRALGNPAQFLAGRDGVLGPPLAPPLPPEDAVNAALPAQP